MSILLGVCCFSASAGFLYVFVAGLLSWKWLEAARLVGTFFLLLTVLAAFVALAAVGVILFTK